MKRFNPIIDTAPETARPSIVEKTDFKQVLKFFALIDDDTLNENEKFYCMLNIFFEKTPDLPAQEIMTAVIDYITGGEKKDAPKGRKTFDWNVDAGRIFAAFWQTYKIDLRSEKMHWYVFNELFQNLPESTELMKVIELRGRKSDKNDSKESKAALRKAQAAVRIDDNKDPLDALASAFDAWGA